MKRHYFFAMGRRMDDFSFLKKKQKNQRQKRVGEEIRGAITSLLPSLIQWTPPLQKVRLTVLHVAMSPDLRRATVFLHPPSFDTVEEKPSPEEVQNMMKALQDQIAPRLRKGFASSLSLRFIPHVFFRIDEEISLLYQKDEYMKKHLSDIFSS